MTYENLRPNGNYEDSDFQIEPADLEAVVDKIAGREHNSTAADRVPDTTRPRGVALPGRIDDELIELWTSPIGYAHDASDHTTTVTAPLYSRLRDLRDKLEGAEHEYYAAGAKGEQAAANAILAAKAAIVAGEPTPIVDVVDVQALQASAAANYGALVQLLREARGAYTTACQSVAPAARAQLAAELPEQIDAVRGAWRAFVAADDLRWQTVESLRELNALADPERRDLHGTGDKLRDRRNGGLLPFDADDLRSIAARRDAGTDAVIALSNLIGSSDTFLSGVYTADELGHGTFPA